MTALLLNEDEEYNYKRRKMVHLCLLYRAMQREFLILFLRLLNKEIKFFQYSRMLQNVCPKILEKQNSIFQDTI